MKVMQDKPVRGDYMTRGYYLVKDVLFSAKGEHLSADDIFDALRAKGESIGRTTVYRQLERLVSEGYARRTSTDRGTGCYSYTDGQCKEHHHLICTACGKLEHLSCDHVEELFSHIKATHGFIIDTSRTTLYGLCAACAREKKQKGHTYA